MTWLQFAVGMGVIESVLLGLIVLGELLGD